MGAVSHCHPATVGETLCLPAHVTLPLNGDIASFTCTSPLRWTQVSHLCRNFRSDWTSAKLSTLARADSEGVLRLSLSPLLKPFCSYAVVSAGIDRELDLCALTRAVWHRPILSVAFVITRSFSLYKQMESG